MIDENTGELSSNQSCPNLSDVLIQCSYRSNLYPNAYAKIRFDRICGENSKSSLNDMQWINQIGIERRKRLHYQPIRSPLVSFNDLIDRC